MATLAEILSGQGLSLVPQLHLQQIGLFLIRKGIELFPSQDEGDMRAKFISRLWRENRTALYLTDIWEKGAKGGWLLLYVRPNGKSYRLNYYEATEFKPYYDLDGELESVTITTNYEIESDRPATRFSKIRLTPLTIEKWDSDREITDSMPDSVMTNPYGFIPCVVIQNKPRGPGHKGSTEFEGLEGQIESHDWQLDQIHGNLEFFGGPIFYSSRSRSEMVEAGMIESRQSVAEAAGYGGVRSQQRIKARRIFDGLEEGEQIGFATPEPLDTGSIKFIADFARQLRAALGSVDESEAEANSKGTSFELKTILGRAIQTASRRADSYLTFGLCEAYSLMLQMAQIDGVIPTVADGTEIKWRHLGDVFQESPQDQLTKSIVCRNLLRLGVNIEECLRFLFPDKRDDELQKLLREGFAYEFLNGIATVAQTLLNARDEQGNYAIAIDEFITEVLAGRPGDENESKLEMLPAGSSTDPSTGGGTMEAANGLADGGKESTQGSTSPSKRKSRSTRSRSKPTSSSTATSTT